MILTTKWLQPKYDDDPNYIAAGFPGKLCPSQLGRTPLNKYVWFLQQGHHIWPGLVWHGAKTKRQAVQPQTTYQPSYKTPWANQRRFPKIKDRMMSKVWKVAVSIASKEGKGEPVAPALMPKLSEHRNGYSLICWTCWILYWSWHPNQNSRCWVKGVWKPTQLWNSDSGFAPWLRWWEIVRKYSIESPGQTCSYNFEEISV